MQDALQEALQQVKVNNPRMSDSILDDQEIMREIEGIFEQGNEKLMASLEEIRREQVRGFVCLVFCYRAEKPCCNFLHRSPCNTNLFLALLLTTEFTYSKHWRPQVPLRMHKPRWTI